MLEWKECEFSEAYNNQGSFFAEKDGYWITVSKIGKIASCTVRVDGFVVLSVEIRKSLDLDNLKQFGQNCFHMAKTANL